MLPTLCNVCLSLILLLSIVVITVLYVCKLRSPARRQLFHTSSPRYRHSNAQPPVAIHHGVTPQPQSRLPVPLSMPKHPISASLNFGTLHGSFVTPSAHMASQIDHEPSTTLPLSHTLPKLPEFWPFNVSGYFSTIEIMFSHSGITEEAPKYSALIQALSKHKQTLTKVADILQNLNQDEPYTQLKTSLLERLCNKIDDSPYTILKQCTKGSDTITEFLICIKATLGTNYDSHSPILTDSIRHHLLEAVDPQIRINLYHYESASLEELAQHADRLIARLKQSHRSQPTPYPGKEPSSNQSLINEVLESRLDSLQRSVSELLQSENHSIAKPPHATQVPSLNSEHHHNRPFNRNSSQLRRCDQPLLCYYHGRFGDRARKCEAPPCPRGTTSLHLRICRTFFLPLPNLSTTAYFSSLTKFPRLAF